MLHRRDDAGLALGVAGDARRGEDRVRHRARRCHHAERLEAAAVERHVAGAKGLQNRGAAGGRGRHVGDVDRPPRLLVRFREVDHDLLLPDVHCRAEVEAIGADPVVLEVVLGLVDAVGELADLVPHPVLGVIHERVADLLEGLDAEPLHHSPQPLLGGVERADHRVEVAPGGVGGAVIGERDAPDVLHVLAARKQLHRRQPEPLLKHLGGGAGEGAHRHAADLGDMGDVGGVADQRAVDEDRLHQQMLRHVALAAVRIVVDDHVALLDRLLHLLHAERHRVQAGADDRRVHLGLAHHAQVAVEQAAREVPRFAEDRRIRGAHHGAFHLVADVAERVVDHRERDRVLLRREPSGAHRSTGRPRQAHDEAAIGADLDFALRRHEGGGIHLVDDRGPCDHGACGELRAAVDRRLQRRVAVEVDLAVGVGLARARGGRAQGRIGALLADGDHPHLGHLGHLVAERVAVELLVLAVEPFERPREAASSSSSVSSCTSSPKFWPM